VAWLRKGEQLGLFPGLVHVDAHTRETSHGPVPVAAHVRHQLVAPAPVVEHAAPQAEHIRVSEYYDAFREHDAPYEWEERVSESGRAYSRKVYLPEAYTADYMDASDETKRLVRWGVRLSDGRTVSRDGVFRLRWPERWDRIRSELARVRGARRDEAVAKTLWRHLEPSEREAMVASIRLEDYVDGRGLTQAVADLEDDLKTSGSLLYWVRGAINPYAMLADAFAVKYTGGPIGSEPWRSCSWETWIRYQMARHGVPVDDDHLSPAELPLAFRTRIETREGAKERWIPHPWLGAIPEFVVNAIGARTAELPVLRAMLEARLHGPVRSWPQDLPSNKDARIQAMVQLDHRIANMVPVDRDAAGKLGYPGFLQVLRYAFKLDPSFVGRSLAP
jgi:hypothetical protein